MPIGLYESGRARARPCDQIARQRLGRRACCVFIPPTRAMLCAQSYAPLRTLGLSVQAYHLIPRIRELDALLTPDLQARVWEAHPELSFLAMTGAPTPHPKRTQAGQAARIDALQRTLSESGDALASLMAAFRQQVALKHAGIDDLLDACALAWSALRPHPRRVGTVSRRTRPRRARLADGYSVLSGGNPSVNRADKSWSPSRPARNADQPRVDVLEVEERAHTHPLGEKRAVQQAVLRYGKNERINQRDIRLAQQHLQVHQQHGVNCLLPLLVRNRLTHLDKRLMVGEVVKK
jgi:hypothetical protein